MRVHRLNPNLNFAVARSLKSVHTLPTVPNPAAVCDFAGPYL